MALALLAVLFLAACGGAPAHSAGVNSEEQRLLPGIIREQQERVRKAEQAASMAQDEAMSLRLRQRMLTEYGRPDLAASLEPEAEKREMELRYALQRLADEETALAAYRAYASRFGTRSGGAETGMSGRHAAGR